MKYGIYLPNFGPYGNARTLAELAHDAEQVGWDGFFIWDHIAGWTLDMVDPWVALTAVALNTQHIRIGTTVTPLPRRRPWKIARETVSLDHLSGGRLTLGIGIGVGEGEWDSLGEESNLRTRGAMLDEALEVLTGLWRGEPFSYEGQFYHIKDACFLPRPLQSPHIPIWVGGFWPNKAPFRRAARWEGMFPLFQVDNNAEELKQLEIAIAYVRERRKIKGDFDIVSMGMTPGGDIGQAIEVIKPYRAMGATWWLECIAPFTFGKGFNEVWPLEAMHQRILQGPPH